LAGLSVRSLNLAPGVPSCTHTLPEGPTSAAWMQSADEEKAQIGAIVPALSRMHQLSALSVAASMLKNAASAPTYTACLIFVSALDHAAAA
jgi:hypothetical protein